MDVNVSREDLNRLLVKLDEFGEVLTESERAVLVTVFGLAAMAISQAKALSEAKSGESPDRAQVPSLSEALKGAFEPGWARRIVFDSGSLELVIATRGK